MKNFLILEEIDDEEEMWSKQGIKFNKQTIKLRLLDEMPNETFKDVQKILKNKKYKALKLVKEK